jgi:hypothetical protein
MTRVAAGNVELQFQRRSDSRSLGALRRRGLGWVSIQCTEEPDEHTVHRFLRLGER